MPIAFFTTDKGDFYAYTDPPSIGLDDRTSKWLTANKIKVARKKDFAVARETPLFDTVAEAEQWLKGHRFPRPQAEGHAGTPQQGGTFEISLLRESFVGQRVSLEKLNQPGWERQSARPDGKLEEAGEPWVHLNTFLSQKDKSCGQHPEFEEYIIIGIQHLDSKVTDILCGAFAKPDVPDMGIFEPPYLFKADYEKAREVIGNVLEQVTSNKNC